MRRHGHLAQSIESENGTERAGNRAFRLAQFLIPASEAQLRELGLEVDLEVGRDEAGLAECAGFELAHPLAGDPEDGADLLERLRVVVLHHGQGPRELAVELGIHRRVCCADRRERRRDRQDVRPTAVGVREGDLALAVDVRAAHPAVVVVRGVGGLLVEERVPARVEAHLVPALAARPDILLLDEPTNHLDLPAIEWLESELKSLRSALVLISHDRRFLENLSRACVWLDRGQTRRLEQGFSAFEAWRDDVLEQEETERHKLDRKIAAEEHWVRYGVTARRKRNVRRMAELAEMRKTRREALKATGTVKLDAAEASRSGTCVVEAKHIAKSYGDAVIVQDFSIRILRKDRVGIVGPNGAGKTTLIKLITGTLAADGGTLKLGANLAMATLDQTREGLDPEATLADVLTGGHGDIVQVGDQRRHVVSYMKDFLFQPEQARQPARVLSGGERARLLLARALATPSNFLVLDEPTNDLDLETLDLLEEMLAAYPGTVLVVSHDRDFLDRVATSVLVAEGEGVFVEYAGGYSDMLAQRGHSFASAAAAKAKSDKPAAPKAKSASTKLSFKDKHALETLPREMAALEAEIARLQKVMTDPDLYSRNPKRFNETSDALAAAQGKLAAHEERWLELEILREQLEG